MKRSLMMLMALALEVLSDGTIAAKGRSLRRTRRFMPETARAALQEAVDALKDLGGWRSWPNGFDDYDQMLIIVRGNEKRLEFAIDIPLSVGCSDTDLVAVWRVWRLSVERVAPAAKCGGVPCSELWSAVKDCEGSALLRQPHAGGASS